MKVLVVTNLYPSEIRPAYGSFIRSQVESLPSVGVETELLIIEGKESRGAYVDAVRRVRWRAASGEIDLIHAHYGYSGWVALCQRRLPVVISFLGDDIQGTYQADGRLHWKSRLIAAVNRRVARGAAAVVVKSQAMAQRMGSTTCHVVPNGVDLKRFRPGDQAEARRALGLPAEGTRILFAANPEVGVKRFDLAAAAVEQLEQDAALDVVRDRPPEEMPLWMNAADALILTSQSEGSPNVVKEALACGLPVVATDVGDVAWLLGLCEGNRLVPVDADPPQIAQALGEVLGTGQTGCPGAMGELSLEAVARRLGAVYQAVLAGGVRETG